MANRPENICSGFRTAGVVPFNPDAIAVSVDPVSTLAKPNYSHADLNYDKENDVKQANFY